MGNLQFIQEKNKRWTDAARISLAGYHQTLLCFDGAWHVQQSV